MATVVISPARISFSHWGKFATTTKWKFTLIITLYFALFSPFSAPLVIADDGDIMATVVISPARISFSHWGKFATTTKWKFTLIITLYFALFSPFSWQAVTSYIDQQYEAYLQDESGLNRRHIVDNRVHCCLYFICPHGHGLVLNFFLQFLTLMFVKLKE